MEPGLPSVARVKLRSKPRSRSGEGTLLYQAGCDAGQDAQAGCIRTSEHRTEAKIGHCCRFNFNGILIYLSDHLNGLASLPLRYRALPPQNRIDRSFDNIRGDARPYLRPQPCQCATVRLELFNTLTSFSPPAALDQYSSSPTQAVTSPGPAQAVPAALDVLRRWGRAHPGIPRPPTKHPALQGRIVRSTVTTASLIASQDRCRHRPGTGG